MEKNASAGTGKVIQKLIQGDPAFFRLVRIMEDLCHTLAQKDLILLKILKEGL